MASAALARDSLSGPPIIDNDVYSAAGVCCKAGTRSQKSLKFRLRRRDQKLKLYGSEFATRDSAKNPMRQIAAKIRKRNAAGKFLDGPRAI